ncbi:MAG: hypothetical protein ACLQVW_28710 [Limisphaerales bacterium]
MLEERLRRLATVNACLPSRPRPTIADFNTELYQKRIYDKVVFKQIDALTAIGNEAAHGNPVKKEDVQRFLTELRELLQRFST